MDYGTEYSGWGWDRVSEERLLARGHLLDVAIIVGFQTRIAALLLAAFSLLTAMLFHNQLGDQTQFIMFMKNVAIADGSLFLAQHGAREVSLDQRRARAAI